MVLELFELVPLVDEHGVDVDRGGFEEIVAIVEVRQLHVEPSREELVTQGHKGIGTKIKDILEET